MPNLEDLTLHPCDTTGEVKSLLVFNFYNYQVLAWLDGGWEGNALSEEEPDFIVCSASGDGEDMLVIGVAMDQEDAILTCKVFKGKCKIIFSNGHFQCIAMLNCFSAEGVTWNNPSHKEHDRLGAAGGEVECARGEGGVSHDVDSLC